MGLSVSARHWSIWTSWYKIWFMIHLVSSMKIWLNRWATFLIRIGLFEQRSMDHGLIWRPVRGLFVLKVIESGHWKDTDGVISLEDLIQSFSIFLRGSREDHIKCKSKMLVRETMAWVTIIFINCIFSCLPNVWFEREWIHNSWRTIFTPSKHFDKISFWWRHWRGTSRTRGDIHEIDGRRTGFVE